MLKKLLSNPHLSPWEKDATLELKRTLDKFLDKELSVFVRQQAGILRDKPELVETPRVEPDYLNRYPVKTWDWIFVDHPHYCARQLFYDLLKDPKLDYYDQPHYEEFRLPAPERQTLTALVDELLVYYRRVYARVQDLWLQHYKKIHLEHEPTGCRAAGFRLLQTLRSPQHVEIQLRLDLALIKEGDRIDFSGYRNTQAYYVYQNQPTQELCVVKYVDSYGYVLPEEAAPLFYQYNQYAFMEDHQTYSFRDICKDDLDPGLPKKKRKTEVASSEEETGGE